MNMGLDEIINKKWKKDLPGKRIGGRAVGGGIRRGRPNNVRGKPVTDRLGINPVKKNGPLLTGGLTSGAKKITDARLKIMARQRRQVKDAREKINALHRQTDARSRLQSTSFRRLGVVRGSAALGDPLPRRTIPNQRERPSNRPVMDTYDSYGGRESVSPLMSRRLGGGLGLEMGGVYRTVDNRDYMEVEEDSGWDPVRLPQLEVRLTRPQQLPQPQHTSLLHQHSILRQRELRTAKDDSWLRPSPLPLRRPDDLKSRLEPSRQEGFRIVVSNLQPSVTHEDIKELFEDIGPLLGSRLVRPGTAEVVYRDIKDAVAAVDTYHNRQLDGQPMKCLLVKPSSSNGKGLMGTKGTVIPDLSTIHKALFMK